LVLLVKLQAVVSGESWLLLRLGGLMLPDGGIVRQKNTEDKITWLQL
jgi:hypothetical protein